MNAKLVVVAGKAMKRVVTLKLPCVLGRSRHADVTVAHPLISRRHCELSEQDGLLLLRDLTSMNGTMIDGRRIESALLLPDAEFTIGPLTFRVVYRYHGDPAGVPPPRFLEEAPDDLTVDEDGMTVGFEEPEVDGSDQTEEEAGAVRESSLGEMALPDFLAMADADPHDSLPPVPYFPPSPPVHPLKTVRPSPPAAVSPPPAPTTSKPAPSDSPWGSAPPTYHHPSVPMPPQPAVPEPPVVAPPPEGDASAAPDEDPVEPPPPPRKPAKKPGYSDDMDPEFGSFLDGLQ